MSFRDGSNSSFEAADRFEEASDYGDDLKSTIDSIADSRCPWRAFIPLAFIPT